MLVFLPILITLRCIIYCCKQIASLIMQICLAIPEILADEAFTATDGLISQSFVVAFVYPAYVQIALIWCQDRQKWTLFIFIFSLLFFFFFFSFILYFYFQNNSGQGLSVTLSHQSQLDGVVTRLITGLKRRTQKELEQSDVIQHGHHMLASCITHGHLGQGAQQLARTMGISI